jgi:hypothetical protein
VASFLCGIHCIIRNGQNSHFQRDVIFEKSTADEHWNRNLYIQTRHIRQVRGCFKEASFDGTFPLIHRFPRTGKGNAPIAIAVFEPELKIPARMTTIAPIIMGAVAREPLPMQRKPTEILTWIRTLHFLTVKEIAL